MLLDKNNSSHWLGQKVCLGFSIRCYGKINPIYVLRKGKGGSKQSPQRKITYGNLIKNLGKCQGLEIWLGGLEVICINKKFTYRTSLVAQWLRIRLPMQGTRVRSLIQEDPTCRVATKPVRHNYWACARKLASHNYWTCVPQLLKPTHLEPVLHNKRSPRSEKPAHHNEE